VIKDLSIVVGERDLLSHATLHLHPGRHYVLVGRNGVGKSILLKSIGMRLVPGIPWVTRILLLGQIQPATDDNTIESTWGSETVLDHVIRSDQRRERLLSEAATLSEAIENAGDPLAIIRAYRLVKHHRLQHDVAEAKLVAATQSGARGNRARKDLIAREQDLSSASEDLSSLDLERDVDATVISEETQKALEMLADVQASLESMNASAAAANARTVLLGLGFSARSLDQPIRHLSGGWRTRCSLACALSQSADLLLLDEPTNFLDLPSIVWLEGYIQNLSRQTTVIVVTHDRAFADGIAEELLVLRNQALERFRGNVSGYEVTRLKLYKYLSRMKDAQERQKEHMQSTIDRNVKAAKRGGDDKKLKQAASRKKKLEERLGMEVSAKGGRFKLNRDFAGFHNSNRAAIDVPTFDPPPRVAIPTSPPDLRFPGPLLSFENVSFAYKQGSRDVPIFQGVNFSIHPGDRVGLVGLNGSGKSTLVSLAMASPGDPIYSGSQMKGTTSRHPRARFGLYSQQAAEELNVIASRNPALTALSHLMDFAGPDLAEKDARGILSSLGLQGKVASDVPISLLSGGQKVRVALAKLLCAPPHLLILDEVTTHLDTETIQALALALRKYEGAILVITHDRFFMRSVVEGESFKSMAINNEGGDDDNSEGEDSDEDDDVADQGVVYRLSKGRLTKLEGGMQQYEELVAKNLPKLGMI